MITNKTSNKETTQETVETEESKGDTLFEIYKKVVMRPNNVITSICMALPTKPNATAGIIFFLFNISARAGNSPIRLGVKKAPV